MVDAVLLNSIATRPMDSAFWSCRLRVNDAMKDDPPVVVSDFNLWGNRWIKAPDGSMITDQDTYSTDAAPEFTAWPEWSVVTDLNSPKFGKVQGQGLKRDSPRQGDDCWIGGFLAELIEIAPQPLWREVLTPLARRQVVDVGAG